MYIRRRKKGAEKGVGPYSEELWGRIKDTRLEVMMENRSVVVPIRSKYSMGNNRSPFHGYFVDEEIIGEI